MYYWLTKNTIEAFMIAAESDRRRAPRSDKRATATKKPQVAAPAKGGAAALPPAWRYGLSAVDSKLS
jgi:hypothetical protein